VGGGRLPTFVVIGAQKAGTTSLYRYLAAHPQIHIPQKELNFFCHVPALQHVGRYEAFFSEAGDRTVVGDVSPNYAMFPLFGCVPEQMATVLPDARIVYLLRNPVERAVAGYLHGLHAGTEQEPMSAGVFRGVHLAVSTYGMQLSLYRRFFSDEQILVVTSEALRHDRVASVRRILGHIGADPELQPAETLETEHHETRLKRRPRPSLRRLGLGAVAARATGVVPQLERLLMTGVDDELDAYSRERIVLHLQSDLRWLFTQRPELSGSWGLLDESILPPD
jgi:hypothetical protein